MMNDMPIESQNGAANEEGTAWVRPEVTRMRAGDAENSNVAVPDAGAGLS